MLDKTSTCFSHVKPADKPWRSEGLRDFFLYKDLGVYEATAGRVIAHLVKANMAPEKGTGWHRHESPGRSQGEYRSPQGGGCLIGLISRSC